MKFRYLFGPVPSRRLGMSLGIDMVPAKVCSMDCVYCEVCRTTKLTTERMEYVPYDEVIAELNSYFEHNPDPDYFTFSGSGEPTLNLRIGDTIQFIKNRKPGIPVAVLTNGTLFYNKDVRMDLYEADVVLPSLDAATEETFRKINQPAPGLTLKNHLQGLIDFRKEFTGKIWLEVFILPGYNDHPAELEKLREAVMRIHPDTVQLNTLDRPGAISDLHDASRQQLNQIATSWGMPNIEIIASSHHGQGAKTYRKDIENTILETIARRPCTAEDLSRILGMRMTEVGKYLRELTVAGSIEPSERTRGVFYQIVKS